MSAKLELPDPRLVLAMFCRELTECNIASYAVDLASALGARTAFTLTGGMAMYLNRAVATHSDLRAVYNQHEQACVAGAEGYAKAKDFQVPGLSVVTSGPGVTNTVTSLCSAYGDSTPLIVLAGQVKTADIDRFGCRTHGAQEVRSEALISPCVKRFLRLSALNFQDQLVDTYAQALMGRPGPVFVEIPLDIQNVPVSYTADDLQRGVQAIRARLKTDRTAPSDVQALTDAVSWLMAAERPLVYVGNGCRIAGVAEAVRSFVVTRGLPAVFSWLSQDVLPGDHALNFGAPGGLAPISANQILGRADRILFLGARLDLGTTAFQRLEFGGQAERVFVDIDPHELQKFADIPKSRTLQANLSAFAAAMKVIGKNQANPDWLKTCSDLRAAYLDDERQRLNTGAFNVYGLAQRLSPWSEGKMFVTTGSGQAVETFLRFFTPAQNSRCFFGASLGAMGLGLPQALGAAFGTERQVICIEADGGLMLNLQELATLAHYAPKGFVLFVLNNDGYASILASQMRHFGSAGGAGRESGVFIPDYQRIAAAFNLDYARVDSYQGFEAMLDTLAPDRPPLFVDLCVAPTEARGPAVKTVIAADGKLSSTPLAELQW
jgi:acetolactate synthase-1/2/3 large subunit